MAGRLIGDAYIVVYPQTDLFGTQLAAQVKAKVDALKPLLTVYPVLSKTAAATVEAQLKGFKGGKVDVTPVVNPAAAAAAKGTLDKILGSSRAGIDVKAAVADLASLDAATGILQRNLSSLRADVNDTAAEARIAALQVAANALEKSLADAAKKEDADLAPFEARLLRIQAAYESLNAAKISLDAAQANSALQALAARTGQLRADLSGMRASVNDTAAEAKIAVLQAQAVALSRALGAAPADADLAPFEAKLLGIGAAMSAITAAEQKLQDETNKTTTVFQRLGLQGAGSLIHVTDLLNAASKGKGGIDLFGGAITRMYAAMRGGDAQMPTVLSHFIAVASAGHLTAEAAIEIAAVWVPATLALTAFAAAATPAVIQVYKQLLNMNTAAKGTGQQFQSLAMQGQSVTAAVKPTVMEAFGIALYAAQNKSSGLAAAMHSLGQGIDQFAAKAAIAFDSNTTGKLFTTGSQDALMLMNSFQQLGSIMGTLFKVVPGYAEVLLGFGNDALTAAADLTKFIAPALQIGLALHGALFYGGLFGTAVATGFSKIAPLAANAAGAIANFAGKYELLGGESGKLATGAADAATALDGLAGGPVIAGIGLLAGAFAAVYLYLKVSKTAADSFNASIQKTVQSASLGQLQSAISAGLKQTTVQYAAALKQVQVAQSQVASSSNTVQFRLDGTNTAVQAATASAGTYKAGLTQLTTEQTNVNSNLTQLARQFGVSIPGALALANTAQITSNQLTSSGAANYDTMAVMIHGAVAELAVMTAGTGTLNQALNALSVTQSSQVTNAQKVAGAYSQWIGIVTGGDSAFTAFEQGQQTLADVMAKGDASGAKLTVTVGKLKEQYALLGTSLNGTSASALAARQAFDQQIQAATTLYGNLQTMAVVSGNTAVAQGALAKSGRDLVAQLLPMAAGSQQATAEVYALAQIVGYAGTDSFPALAKWLGNTKGAEADLNQQQAILTLSSANLTQAARDLAAAVGSEVTAAEAQAIAKTEDLSGKTLALADAFSKSGGAASAQVVAIAGNYYSALIQAGVGATTAKNDVDAFLTRLGATGGVVAQVNAALASLPRQVNISINVAENISMTAGATAAQNAAANLLNPLGHAAGGVVRGGGPAGKDSVHAMLAPGELIVPASHAPKFRDMARKASIPGFAGGGVLEPVLGGNWAGLPYSYASLGAPYAAGPASAGTGLPGMTSYQAGTLITLMQQQNKLLAQQPYAYAQALNQANGNGVRRGFFATAG